MGTWLLEPGHTAAMFRARPWGGAARETSFAPARAAVGVFVRSERWESVYPDVGVTLLKTRRGLGAGVSIGL